MTTDPKANSSTVPVANPDRGKSATDKVVDIFGRRYNIGGTHDPETLRALARYVDQRMRQVSKQVAPGDIVGVAVMAALNIADDYYKAREHLEQHQTETTETTRRLAQKLASALESVD